MLGASCLRAGGGARPRSSGRHDTNRRWAEAARKLHFTKDQLTKMLGVRTEHLKRLNRIYEERRQVNLEAISVLVRAPRPPGPPSPRQLSVSMEVSLSSPMRRSHRKQQHLCREPSLLIDLEGSWRQCRFPLAACW